MKANRIRVNKNTYKRFYEFDGGVYFVPEQVFSGFEPWVAIMNDNTVELLFDGHHSKLENAVYEVIE